jgi:hypothetical protein
MEFPAECIAVTNSRIAECLLDEKFGQIVENLAEIGNFGIDVLLWADSFLDGIFRLALLMTKNRVRG